MPSNWSKGFTKYTHPSVKKISETMKRRKIDNFAKWREKAKRKGLIPRGYPSLEKNGDLAEFIGVVLGDGHIHKHERTESLLIASNSNNPGFINRYSGLVEKLFKKKPHLSKARQDYNCVRIRVYQKYLSKRLGIPTGNRGKIKFNIPAWIWKNNEFLIRFLRGLYEAEGSFCVHKPTSTYKLLFANRNKSLLDIVFIGLQKIGFRPHRSLYKIQLSKKEEVYKCKDLIQFRYY